MLPLMRSSRLSDLAQPNGCGTHLLGARGDLGWCKSTCWFPISPINRVWHIAPPRLVHRPLRQYRGSLLRRCSEMHYGNVRLQTNATTWFSGPVASHNELTMFQFCNLFTHSWTYFMGCYILLWTPDASRPNCIMWLWCSWNQIPCLGKGFVCISTFPECIAVGHVLAIDEVVYWLKPLYCAISRGIISMLPERAPAPIL